MSDYRGAQFASRSLCPQACVPAGQQVAAQPPVQRSAGRPAAMAPHVLAPLLPTPRIPAAAVLVKVEVVAQRLKQQGPPRRLECSVRCAPEDLGRIRRSAAAPQRRSSDDRRTVGGVARDASGAADELARLRAERDEARGWARALLTLAELGARTDGSGLGDMAVGVVPSWPTVLRPDRSSRPTDPSG
jgi:hypothetical protein